MKKIFVSGCYDIVHAGHIQFFKDARALGDHLTVCFASDKVLAMYKGRKGSLPEDNKEVILKSFSFVDDVVKSSNLHPIFDFEDHIKRIKPQILAVTEDDKNVEVKKEFCEKLGIELVILPKNNSLTKTSTSNILRGITKKETVPLRVDFAGGWLDVPKYSRAGGFVVNCAISPCVSSDNWPYEIGGGLGGSAAKAILDIKNGVSSEKKLGVGWQDPAVIEETGLCVWRSGKKPVLDFKCNPDWLAGKMLILWTGKNHNTPSVVSKKRDYNLIFKAGILAKNAVEKRDIKILAKAVLTSYKAQLGEGMEILPEIKGAIAKKYLGGGHGGYALYLFENSSKRKTASKIKGVRIIEPYLRER